MCSLAILLSLCHLKYSFICITLSLTYIYTYIYIYGITDIYILSYALHIPGVNGFTLDPRIGEFVLTHPNVRIPDRGRFYSFNEANQYKWKKSFQKYISDIKQGKGELGLSYTSRYIGSLVGDIHRTLLYGGIFGYPEDTKRPKGKLALLHEAGPIAFLVEQVKSTVYRNK